MDQRARIAIAELVDPIGAPDQDQDDRQGQEGEEDLEGPLDSGLGGFGGALPAQVLDGVIEREGDEESQGEDLE